MEKSRDPTHNKQEQMSQATTQAVDTTEVETSLLGLSVRELESMIKPQIILVTLKQTMAAGTFVDAKFYAFSRRRGSNLVNKPLPVYANSTILAAQSSYFAGRTYDYIYDYPPL